MAVLSDFSVQQAFVVVSTFFCFLTFLSFSSGVARSLSESATTDIFAFSVLLTLTFALENVSPYAAINTSTKNNYAHR